MTHREARLVLVDLAAGALDDAARDDLLRHVAACSECAKWLGTYRFLQGGLSGGLPWLEGGPDHPSSELLARGLVAREELPRSSQREIVVHLRRCQRCREEARLLSSALRPARPHRLRGDAAERRAARRRGWAGATTLAAAAAAFLVLVMPPRAPSPSPSLATGDAAEAPSAKDLELRGQELEGRQRIEGAQTLTLREVKIREGAEVTFRAGKRLALGDGVAIGLGTRVVFETADEEDSRTPAPIARPTGGAS